MSEPDDLEMLAAEYALGTLDAAERAAVERRRAADPDLQARIADWERRLSPMLEEVADEAPPAGLLPRISGRLGWNAAAALPAEVITLRRKLAGWRAAAVAAGALAAALAGVLLVGVTAPPPRSFVAVFQQDDVLPSFLLTIDLETREVTIRPVAARPVPEKVYQLWIASDALGPAPQSLGLLDPVDRATRKRLQRFEPELLRTATFGISLEPPGGSPTGRPTGPALHGTLHPVRP